MKEKTKKKGAKPKKHKDVYPCTYCHKSFENSSNWLSHVKLHSTELPYSCHLCDYKCKVKKYLTRHVNKTHSKPTGHQCTICGKCFHFDCALRNHMRVHTGEKPNKCNECGKAFSSLYSLQTHKLIHTGEKPFQCRYCDYACRDSSTIRKHMERHLGISKDYPCSVCNKNFKKKLSLKAHIDEVHFDLDPRKYPCEQCHKMFKTKKTLASHIISVHNKTNRVTCEICGLVITKNNLQSHMRRHIDIRPYRCSYKPCGKRFKNMGDLKRHQVIHYPDYQHVCTVCNRRFPRKWRLLKHTLNGCQRAQCHHCGQLFTAKKFLARHIKNAHGPYPKCREYLCDVCDMVTYNRRTIIQHLKYGHGTEKDTECQICRKDYFRSQTLKEHYLSHHNFIYTLMDQKKDDLIEIKEEPLEVIEQIADPSEFIYEVDIQKTEIDDISSEPPSKLQPPSPEHFLIDTDTITYSKKVLSEDISRSLIDRSEGTDVFHELFIGHALDISGTPPVTDLPKQIVDEEKQKCVEKSLEELLTNVRKRNQWVVLEKLRRQYNTRIRIARGDGEKKEQTSIRYFKKQENNNESTKIQDNTKNDEESNIIDDDLINDQENDELDTQNIDSEQENTKKNIEKSEKNIENSEKNIENSEKNIENDEETISVDKIGEDTINDDEMGDGDETIDDEKDLDYREDDFESDEEANPNRKIKFNTHQCYICFKLFKTKTDLKRHCTSHFDICNEKMLKKCPFCGYVTNLTISRHIKLVHNISLDIPYARIKEKDTGKGSKYVFEIDKDCDLEIIPSISNLNKIASMKIDEKNRASKNIFLGTTKLVKKGGDWMVEKEKVDVNAEYLLPEFEMEDYLQLKSIGEGYLENLRLLSIVAKKKGLKILYPCEGCDKICLTMAALKLHSRKHEINPKKYKTKVWKNKILNGIGGKYRYVNKIKKKEKKYEYDRKKNNTIVDDKITTNKNVKKNRLVEKIGKNKMEVEKIENRFADPNPVKNKHNCDRELIDFYYKNIKGGDIEFWQFLKIFNKMSRENVKDFKDLENRHDFGMHTIKENNQKVITEPNKKEIVEKNKPKTKKPVKMTKKAFIRKIMIGKKEYARRMEIKKQMRQRMEEAREK